MPRPSSRPFRSIIGIGALLALLPVSAAAASPSDRLGAQVPPVATADAAVDTGADEGTDPFVHLPDPPLVALETVRASLDGTRVGMQHQLRDGDGSLAHLFGGFAFRLLPRGGSDLDGNLLRVRGGSAFDVRLGGFEPGTTVEAWLFPGGVRLGTTSVDGAGAATLPLRAPDDLPACSHTLYLRGYFDGEIRDDVVPIDPPEPAGPERRLAEIVVGIGALPATYPFTDIGPSSTHGFAVGCLADRGVTRGTTATTFDPWGVVTRGQAASLLAREAGLVGPSASHGAAVQALSRIGVMEGYGGGDFGLDDALTRGQAASLMARLHGLPSAPIAFPDAGGVHGGAVGALASLGVVEGYRDGTFGTDDEVERAPFASMMFRFEQSQLTRR